MTPDVLSRLKAKLPPANDRAALERVATGSGVPYHTLLKIVKGETTDPRLSTVESLLRWCEEAA